MNINIKNPIIKYFITRIQKFDKNTYWEMRDKVVDKQSKLPKFFRYYLLYKIMKIDAFNNASFGTDINGGAMFDSPPQFTSWIKWYYYWT